MPQFELIIDDRNLQAQLDEVYKLLAHIKNGPEKAISRAMNHGAKTGQSYGAKLMQETLTAKQKDLKLFMPIKRATYSEPVAVLKIESKPIPAIDFKHSYRKKSRGGTMIQMWQGRPPVNWPHAFVAKMESGHEGIFVRTGKFNKATKGRYFGMRREMIAEVSGINLATIFNNTRGLRGSILDTAAIAAMKELHRQVEFLLKLEEGNEPTGFWD